MTDPPLIIVLITIVREASSSHVKVTPIYTPMPLPILSAIDWLRGADSEVFYSCHVHFCLVYHVSDSLNVILIIHA